MFKRLAAAASVSALIVLGSVSGATAATTSSDQAPAVTVKPHKFKQKLIIDWDTTPADGGGATTQRIDWD